MSTRPGFVAWRHSTQPMTLLDPLRAPPPVVREVVDVPQLIAALRDVLALSDDHSMHTHDRLLAARMRAAEGLRAAGIEPKPARGRLT
jgi:hypothetical protein